VGGGQGRSGGEGPVLVGAAGGQEREQLEPVAPGVEVEVGDQHRGLVTRGLHEHPAWARGLLGAAAGQEPGMDPDQERVRHRADELLPEERVAGSDDPQAQAAAILADSDEREYDPQAAPDTVLERRTSAEATDPPE